MKQLSIKELEQIIGGVSQTSEPIDITNLNASSTCICDYIDLVVNVTNENTVDSCKCRCNAYIPQNTHSLSLNLVSDLSLEQQTSISL